MDFYTEIITGINMKIDACKRHLSEPHDEDDLEFEDAYLNRLSAFREAKVIVESYKRIAEDME